MTPTLRIVVTVAVAAVSAAFGLERRLQLYKIRSVSVEYFLDHVIRPNEKNLISNFSRQMPIAQMPGEAYKLIGILMSDFNDRLRSRLDFQPSPIVQL